MVTLFRSVGATAGVPKGLCVPILNPDGRYSTLECPMGTDYQVPAGKTFKITKVIFVMPLTGDAFDIGYGDDAVENSTTPPTNYVRVLASGATYTLSFLYAAAGGTVYVFDVYGEIPAGKFPCVQSKANPGIHVIGIEE